VLAVATADPGRIKSVRVADGTVFEWEGGEYARVTEQWMRTVMHSGVLPWVFMSCGRVAGELIEGEGQVFIVKRVGERGL
jgi:hypothetical protein